VTFRRGFKTEAERIAAEVRSELGLRPIDALDVNTLAEHFGLPIVPISRFDRDHARPEFLNVFQVREPDSFSALTLFTGTARLILHNDAHHPHRQKSDIAHEISHCLLEHQPAPVVSDEGCRHWNAVMEAEADWLGAALLVPRDGGLTWAKRGQNLDQIAEHYGVSEGLCRWRLHQTGVIQQLERLSRWRP
jgi:Zn-dependent peptidase ImmA (M78 family)